MSHHYSGQGRGRRRPGVRPSRGGDVPFGVVHPLGDDVVHHHVGDAEVSGKEEGVVKCEAVLLSYSFPRS